MGRIAVVAAACGAVLVLLRLGGGLPNEPVRGPQPAGTPSGVAARLVPVASHLTQPVGLVFAPGDAEKRLFVVEKTGTVRALRATSAGTLALDAGDPLVDLTGKVSQGTEQGLLGLAFHPDWAKNGRFFVNYTDTKGDTNVVEYPGAKRLLKVKQPYANHNGGDLVFGPDGKLWIGLGDGGAGGDPHGNGQNATARLAKMLKLDVDAKSPEPEIWAKGLRNPWRYSFDRQTHDLYIADVGQDRYEEVDVVPAAALGSAMGPNFGWNVMEGMHCFSPASGCKTDGLTMPVVEYAHPAGCSITGGYVYRGRALPALDGLYFYADYCTGMLRAFRWSAGGGVTDYHEWRPVADPKEQVSLVSTWGEDADGELYVVSLTGTIWKLEPASP